MSKNKPTYYGTTGLFAQPIGQGLHKHHKSIFKSTGLELIRLGTHWPQIVGEFMTHSTRPVKLHYTKTSATLHISTHSGAALELQHMQPVILQRITEVLGHSKIQRLKFVAAG